ncbi:MAG: hypothetical protein AAFP84_06700 [Actinomycetota bacterium]
MTTSTGAFADAFAAFDRLDADLPAPSTRTRCPLAENRTRSPFVIGSAAAAIAGVGLIGLFVAADRTDRGDQASSPLVEGDVERGTGRDGEAIAPTTTTPTATTVAPGRVADVRYWCRGAIGVAGEEQIFDDCSGEIEYGIVDYVCTGFVGVDADGRSGFTDCDPIAADSAVPGINSLPGALPLPEDDRPPRFATTTYVIREGDLPMRVAAAHCITLEQLNLLNADVEGYRAFLVGAEIVVRDRNPGDGCTNDEAVEYVVVAGDWPLLVADLHCVSLEDMVAFNGWESDIEFPFPGSTILIPPGSCTDG